MRLRFPYAPSRSMTGISPDWGVLFAVFSLVLIGTLMVFSASISVRFSSPSIKLPLMLSPRQACHFLRVAAVVAVIVTTIPMKVWKQFPPLLSSS